MGGKRLRMPWLSDGGEQALRAHSVHPTVLPSTLRKDIAISLLLRIGRHAEPVAPLICSKSNRIIFTAACLTTLVLDLTDIYIWLL